MAWSDAARAAAAEARRRHAKQDKKVVGGIMREYTRLAKFLIRPPNLSSGRDIQRWRKDGDLLMKQVAKQYGLKYK